MSKSVSKVIHMDFKSKKITKVEEVEYKPVRPNVFTMSPTLDSDVCELSFLEEGFIKNLPFSPYEQAEIAADVVDTLRDYVDLFFENITLLDNKEDREYYKEATIKQLLTIFGELKEVNNFVSNVEDVIEDFNGGDDVA